MVWIEFRRNDESLDWNSIALQKLLTVARRAAWKPAGTVVTAADALALADALAQALDDIPDCALVDPVGPPNADCDAYEFFSGKYGKGLINEAIAFCRRGAFEMMEYEHL